MMNSEAIGRRWRIGLRTLYLAACACVLFGVGGYLRTPIPAAQRGAQAAVPQAFAPRRANAPNVSATPAPQLAPGVVWVNTKSHIYHYPGQRWYGHTQDGKYMQEADAIAEGDRATKNGQ